MVVYDDYVRIELHNVPGSLKGNDARLTDDSEPCDVHMILARFSRKKIHAFIPRDKNVSKIGGGEENWTPVRKLIHATFYERILPIEIPLKDRR